MAVTAVASTITTAGGAGTPITTSGIATTGAVLAEITIASYGPTGALTVSDSKSNSWTALTARVQADVRVQKFYAVCSASGKNGTGHTFSAIGASGYCVLMVKAYGSTTGGSLKFASENGAASGGTVATISTGSVTPAFTGSLVTTGLALGFTYSSLSINSGQTIINQAQYGVALNVGGASADEVQTSITTRNPAWSWSGSMTAAAVIAVYTYTPNISLAPAAGAIVAAGNAPVGLLGSPTVYPAAGAIVALGQLPQILGTLITVAPASGAMTLVGTTPVLAYGGFQPGVGLIVFGGLAPSVAFVEVAPALDPSTGNAIFQSTRENILRNALWSGTAPDSTYSLTAFGTLDPAAVHVWQWHRDRLNPLVARRCPRDSGDECGRLDGDEWRRVE